MLQNSRLGKGKRKAEEQIIHFPAFKRKTLDRVCDRSRLDTDRIRWEDERETGGLTQGFTDISTKQPIYPAVLSCNVAPFFLSPETDKKESTVNRSYADLRYCADAANIGCA